MVRKIECSSTALTLHEGDVVLSFNGQIITRVSELDAMYDHAVLDTVVLRDRQELRLQVPTIPADDLETDHAVIFCGAVLHKPHHAVRQQISRLHSGVYVSARTRGSPACQYGLAPTNFIVAVNGIPTPDLTVFVREVVKVPDNTYLRLKAVTFDNVPWVVTMKKNEHYFPTIEFIKDAAEPCGWRRMTYEDGEVKKGMGELEMETLDESEFIRGAANEGGTMQAAS